MNNTRSAAFVGILLVGSVFVVGVGQSQQRSKPPVNINSDSDTYCPTYLLTVTVNLGHQHDCSELSKDDFSLYDNAERQAIPFWTRIHTSGSQDVIYALGYHPPVDVFDNKLHKIWVEVRTNGGKKLRAKFTPQSYRATKEAFDGP